ncbi:MAG: hypothetical protein U5N58_10145 [Actinomycetota bacterium]|nr:hypothetical protein [Actinomycetota bacterium]
MIVKMWSPDSIRNAFDQNISNAAMVESYVNDRLEKYVYKKVKIRPIVTTKIVSV